MRRLLLIVLLLCPLVSMAEMRCGTLGHSIIRFDSKYTFLPESYEGVSYWGGEGWKNRTKGCSDQLSSVTFTVDWPSLEASRNGTYFTNSSPDRIAFTYRENNAKDTTRSLEEHLQYGLRYFGAPVLSMSQIRELAQFDVGLSLYEISMPRRSANHFYQGYWAETGDSTLSTVIVCTRHIIPARSRCLEEYVDWEHGLWIQIDFYFDRLPDWQAMRKQAVAFLEQFRIKEIGK